MFLHENLFFVLLLVSFTFNSSVAFALHVTFAGKKKILQIKLLKAYFLNNFLYKLSSCEEVEQCKLIPLLF